MKMHSLGKLLIFTAVISALFFSCTPSEKYLKTKMMTGGSDKNYVRVLLKKESGMFKISSSGGVRVTDKKSGKVVYESNKGGLVFYPEKIKSDFIIETGDNPVYVDNAGYRGKVELHNVLGKIHIINIVNIEDYLSSVVPSEMPSGWHLEALKAQAIASRTYSYYHILNNRDANTLYDLDATTNFQVYRGIESEKESSTKAVNETAGIILTYNYEPILAYFHSTSGDKTSDDKYVWSGEDLPYLASVKCRYDKDSPHYEWTTELTLAEIESALKNRYERMGSIKKITFRKIDDRVVEVIILHSGGDIKLSGNQFRLLFPSGKLKSTYFTAKQNNKSFHIYGKGWGHGVGMCQWGAKGGAEAGLNYEKILSLYYKDVKLTRINNNYLAHKRGSGKLVN